jgi:hypothetical protein
VQSPVLVGSVFISGVVDEWMMVWGGYLFNNGNNNCFIRAFEANSIKKVSIQITVNGYNLLLFLEHTFKVILKFNV